MIQDYADLQLFAIDADAPFRNIWELTDNTFEQDELSTQPVRIPESVAIKFALIDKNAEMASCHNVVLVYIHFSDTVHFSDQVHTRLRYADIAKIEVFEKDAGQVVKKSSTESA